MAHRAAGQSQLIYTVCVPEVAHVQAEPPAHPPLASRSNSVPVGRPRVRPKPVQKPDGILMLLDACEALDLHPRMAGHRSARHVTLLGSQR